MRVTTLVLSIAFALIMLSVGIPMMLKRIRPNAWVGIRVPRTMEDTDTWYKVNEYAGHLMSWIGAVIGLASILLFFVAGISDSIYYLAMIASIVVGGLAVVILSVSCIKSLD